MSSYTPLRADTVPALDPRGHVLLGTPDFSLEHLISGVAVDVMDIVRNTAFSESGAVRARSACWVLD